VSYAHLLEINSLSLDIKMAIGGYFELELNEGHEYHSTAIRLNSGRNAFEYILRAKGYKNVHLPYYLCDALLQPLARLRISHQFYPINEALEPVFDFSRMKSDAGFVYINYFGLQEKTIKSLAKKTSNLIVDNAMGFFAKPIEEVDTFYSPRKFFGVPDGAYLYTKVFLKEALERDVSMNRLESLLRRIECGPENGYPYFVKNEGKFNRLRLKEMSKLTQRLLRNINYDEASMRRFENFQILHKALAPLNKLSLSIDNDQIPMAYPLYAESNRLREKLIQKRIFVGQYWKNVHQWTELDSIESRLTENIVPLPVDQRYSNKDMERIIWILNEIFRENNE
jgi:hypothetical protein